MTPLEKHLHPLCDEGVWNWIQDFFSWLQNERRLSKETVRSYRHDMKDFFLFLREHQGKAVLSQSQLESLTKRDIRAFLTWRVYRHVSHRSNARNLSALRTFFQFLVRGEKIPSSVFLSLKTPRFSKSLPR